VIARQTGFADRSRMRRAFIRILGQPPQAVRRNARVETRELRNAEGAKPRLRRPREARKRTTREPIPA
jgi:AraC-like DNA-binding protein